MSSDNLHQQHRAHALPDGATTPWSYHDEHDFASTDEEAPFGPGDDAFPGDAPHRHHHHLPLDHAMEDMEEVAEEGPDEEQSTSPSNTRGPPTTQKLAAATPAPRPHPFQAHSGQSMPALPRPPQHRPLLPAGSPPHDGALRPRIATHASEKVGKHVALALPPALHELARPVSAAAATASLGAEGSADGSVVDGLDRLSSGLSRRVFTRQLSEFGAMLTHALGDPDASDTSGALSPSGGSVLALPSFSTNLVPHPPPPPPQLLQGVHMAGSPRGGADLPIAAAAAAAPPASYAAALASPTSPTFATAASAAAAVPGSPPRVAAALGAPALHPAMSSPTALSPTAAGGLSAAAAAAGLPSAPPSLLLQQAERSPVTASGGPLHRLSNMGHALQRLGSLAHSHSNAGSDGGAAPPAAPPPHPASSPTAQQHVSKLSLSNDAVGVQASLPPHLTGAGPFGRASAGGGDAGHGQGPTDKATAPQGAPPRRSAGSLAAVPAGGAHASAFSTVLTTLGVGGGGVGAGAGRVRVSVAGGGATFFEAAQVHSWEFDFTEMEDDELVRETGSTGGVGCRGVFTGHTPLRESGGEACGCAHESVGVCGAGVGWPADQAVLRHFPAERAGGALPAEPQDAAQLPARRGLAPPRHPLPQLQPRGARAARRGAGEGWVLARASTGGGRTCCTVRPWRLTCACRVCVCVRSSAAVDPLRPGAPLPASRGAPGAAHRRHLPRPGPRRVQQQLPRCAAGRGAVGVVVGAPRCLHLGDEQMCCCVVRPARPRPQSTARASWPAFTTTTA